jgi:hypothetical protein
MRACSRRGLVRNAWANVCTGPDGTFALAGLDPFRVLLEVDAPGFVPASMPVARDAGRISIVLHTEARVVLRLQDAAGGPAEHPNGSSLPAAPSPGSCRIRSRPTATASSRPASWPTVHSWCASRARRCGCAPNRWPACRSAAHPAAALEQGTLCCRCPARPREQRADVVLLIDRDGACRTR